MPHSPTAPTPPPHPYTPSSTKTLGLSQLYVKCIIPVHYRILELGAGVVGICIFTGCPSDSEICSERTKALSKQIGEMVFQNN